MSGTGPMAGLSDVDNAALLCQRHHTVVSPRRLWAEVRTTPDELGRYVVWDLHPGSYDQHLQRLRHEQSMHDPPPLTRQRLLELVAAVTHSDEADRRLAQHDLDLLSDAWHDWDHQARSPSTPPTRTTAPGIRPTSRVGAGHHTDATAGRLTWSGTLGCAVEWVVSRVIGRLAAATGSTGEPTAGHLDCDGVLVDSERLIQDVDLR